MRGMGNIEISAGKAARVSHYAQLTILPRLFGISRCDRQKPPPASFTARWEGEPVSPNRFEKEKKLSGTDSPRPRRGSGAVPEGPLFVI